MSTATGDSTEDTLLFSCYFVKILYVLGHLGFGLRTITRLGQAGEDVSSGRRRITYSRAFSLRLAGEYVSSGVRRSTSFRGLVCKVSQFVF